MLLTKVSKTIAQTMENISRNLPNICTFSFVRHSKYKRPRGARSSCAYDGWRIKKARCACTHDVIQDGAEKADERRKMYLQSPSQYHRKPKIRMRSPNVERNKYIFCETAHVSFDRLSEWSVGGGGGRRNELKFHEVSKKKHCRYNQLFLSVFGAQNKSFIDYLIIF